MLRDVGGKFMVCGWAWRILGRVGLIGSFMFVDSFTCLLYSLLLYCTYISA